MCTSPLGAQNEAHAAWSGIQDRLPLGPAHTIGFILLPCVPARPDSCSPTILSMPRAMLILLHLSLFLPKLFHLNARSYKCFFLCKTFPIRYNLFLLEKKIFQFTQLCPAMTAIYFCIFLSLRDYELLREEMESHSLFIPMLHTGLQNAGVLSSELD